MEELLADGIFRLSTPSKAARPSSISAGGDEYVVKPFDRARLRTKLALVGGD